MPKQIQTTVYTFDELSDTAKDKARDWYRSNDFGGTESAWECTNDDAKNVGLKIIELSQHRWNRGGGEFVSSALDTARKILTEHGKECATWATAASFIDAIEGINGINNLVSDDEERDEKQAELESEFLQSLLEAYRVMYEKEVEYQDSEEQVDESIIANEYEFTEDGKRFEETAS